MKLRVKFSILSILVVIQSLGTALFITALYGRYLALSNYQYELALAKYDYEQIFGFTNKVSARGINMDEMVDQWIELLQVAEDQFEELQTNKARMYMNANTDEIVSNLGGLWDMLSEQLSGLTEIYENISRANVSFMFKNTASQSGIRTAIENYQDYEDLSDLNYQLKLSRERENSLDLAYDTFSSVVNSLIEEVNYIVEGQRLITSIIAIGFTLILGVVIALIIYITTRRIVERLGNLRNMAKSLSEKDFTVSLEPKGKKDEVVELQVDLNHTVSHLNDIFDEIKISASDVEHSGKSINEVAKNTSTATHEITTSVESMTQQFGTLNEAVNDSLRAISQMSTISQILVEDNHTQSNSIAQSNEAVTEVVDTLENISRMATEKTRSAEEMQFLVSDGDEKITATNNLLNAITAQLDEVGNIVNIINTIAEQTNLLSMNAAIESSHAGEAGKGFGVVAEEIRGLAENTAENAEKIEISISTIIDKVRDANHSSENASQAFAKVSESAKGLLDALRDITGGINNIDEQTKKISDQTNEISNSAAKINNHCEKLVNQQNHVTDQMKIMNSIFNHSMDGINAIKHGTQDIMVKMHEVNDMSSDSYQKMSNLELLISEFKTLNDRAAEEQSKETEELRKAKKGNVDILKLTDENASATDDGEPLENAAKKNLEAEELEIESSLDDVEQKEEIAAPDIIDISKLSGETEILEGSDNEAKK